MGDRGQTALGEQRWDVGDEHPLAGAVHLSRHKRPEIRTTTYRNVQRFRGGLVFKAHRLLHHSTLGLRVIKKKKTPWWERSTCLAVRGRGSVDQDPPTVFKAHRLWYD